MDNNSNKRMILTIDDEPTIRSAVQLILSRRNCQVVGAQDPGEAEAQLKTQTFDLILLDVKLGKASGLELLKKLREELKIATPVLLMSGLADTERIQEACKYDIKGFLLKPFNSKGLEEKVFGVLDAPSKPQAA
ncbi:response regulator [Bdellovibrio sp. HCB288]|uniref:response regulator n=1 Tax=Bdellovibrio sp. HCB288 TaxID=3394355 RepID=UPI0039B40EF7